MTWRLAESYETLRVQIAGLPQGEALTAALIGSEAAKNASLVIALLSGPANAAYRARMLRRGCRRRSPHLHASGGWRDHASVFMHMKYRIYNVAPADTSIDMDDETSRNGLIGGYLLIS